MNKIPVSLIAGFLGAGKTTLLNRLLNEQHGIRIGVLVNDFGEISIDSQLITNIEGETISLANGCVCCTIRDDLVNAVLQLTGTSPSPDYIITETSGISDPKSAAMALVMSTEVAAKTELNAIVTVIDAELIMELEHTDQKLAIDQLEAADIIINNKTDLVTDDLLQEVRAWILSVAPNARVIDAVYGQVPMELVFGINNILSASGQLAGSINAAGKIEEAETTDIHHTHTDHSKTYSSFTWEHDQPLSFQKIYHAFKTLPLSVFRAKGILQLQEVTDKRVVLQMVGKRVILKKGEPWFDIKPASQIVAIGPFGDIDENELAELFDSCLAGDDTVEKNRLADAVVEILRSG